MDDKGRISFEKMRRKEGEGEGETHASRRAHVSFRVSG